MLLGLSAAYTQCQMEEALPILIRLADWFGYQVLDKLTDDQIQRLLICEHGSINESYVEAYELTGEKRFLDWARRLNDHAMWGPLSEGKDILLDGMLTRRFQSLQDFISIISLRVMNVS